MAHRAAAASLLLLPLLAMQVTAEVSWTASDFAVFGACLLGAGLAFEGTVRKTGDRTYRSAVGVALAQAVVTGIVLLAWDSPDGALLQILSLNGFFVVCWLASARLFRASAQRGTGAATASSPPESDRNEPSTDGPTVRPALKTGTSLRER